VRRPFIDSKESRKVATKQLMKPHLAPRCRVNVLRQGKKFAACARRSSYRGTVRSGEFESEVSPPKGSNFYAQRFLKEVDLGKIDGTD
jgi:hypothetical protein